MIVKSLSLKEFRNYKELYLDLNPEMNIIIGENGSGKTNILESLTVLSNTKSFRTNVDEILIRDNEEYARIIANVDDIKYKVVINRNSKSFVINNEVSKKTSDFIGKVNVILFEPRDLNVFKASPKDRRHILDLEIGKVSKLYMKSMLEYTKLLKDKNVLLKQDKIDETYLDLINESMIKPIFNIEYLRNEFINAINVNISRYYYALSNQKADIKLVFDKCANIDEESIRNMINSSKEKDLIFHHTTKGPNRDDVIFYFNDKLLSDYTSQGQKRMTMIAFKLALIDYIKAKSNIKPILLLDDILSELDKENRVRLLNILPKDVQKILTTTDLDGLSIKSDYRLFKLRKEGK